MVLALALVGSSNFHGKAFRNLPQDRVGHTSIGEGPKFVISGAYKAVRLEAMWVGGPQQDPPERDVDVAVNVTVKAIAPRCRVKDPGHPHHFVLPFGKRNA